MFLRKINQIDFGFQSIESVLLSQF